MALQIESSTVLGGRLCNREKGRITGELRLRGKSEPVRLTLKGNPHRDLAGRTLTFANPSPDGPAADTRVPLHADQTGYAGDITASRKVRVPTVSDDEAHRCFVEDREIPTVWKNSIYLEWYSEKNGRVVLEAPGFTCEISDPAWIMTDEEEIETHRAAENGFVAFLDTICKVANAQEIEEERAGVAFNDDTDGAPMNEFEWERFLKESDRRTDRVMEIHEKFEGDPDCEEKIAHLMGWNLPEEAYGRIDSDPDLEADMDADEWRADETETPEDAAPRSRPAHNSLTERVMNLVMKHDRKSQQPDTPVFDLCSELMLLSAKLAGALDRLEDEESDYEPEPGFTIACLKRCLPILDRALKAATETGGEKDTIAELFLVRDAILTRMEELRARG